MKIYLSIIIPLFNEAENLELLNDRIKEVMKSLNASYEIIYIDDGSTDGSYNILQGLTIDSHIKVIKLAKNYGQTAAMKAGIDYAEGEIIIPMDADMQNCPEDIPKMLGKYNKGYDIVSGWRKNRQDKFLNNVLSKIANKLICSLFNLKIHDLGCTLKIYNAEVLKNINLHGNMHRYIPILASFNGAKITEIPVNHIPRKFGKSKYNLLKIFNVIKEIIKLRFCKRYTKDINIYSVEKTLNI